MDFIIFSVLSKGAALKCRSHDTAVYLSMLEECPQYIPSEARSQIAAELLSELSSEGASKQVSKLTSHGASRSAGNGLDALCDLPLLTLSLLLSLFLFLLSLLNLLLLFLYAVRGDGGHTGS